jgi:hypothetical protein
MVVWQWIHNFLFFEWVRAGAYKKSKSKKQEKVDLLLFQQLEEAQRHVA